MTDKKDLQKLISQGFSDICDENNLAYVTAIVDLETGISYKDYRINKGYFVGTMAVLIYEFAKDTGISGKKLFNDIKDCMKVWEKTKDSRVVK